MISDLRDEEREGADSIRGKDDLLRMIEKDAQNVSTYRGYLDAQLHLYLL